MVIGITGGIATGKSTVSHYIQELGYPLMDADKIAYDALTIDTTSIQCVLSHFDCGQEDNQNQIDRQKLGSIIFNNKKEKEKLEAIIHPIVRNKMEAFIKAHQNTICFLDIPLLYESHFDDLCDEVIVVYLDAPTQCIRLMKRNNLSEAEAKNKMANQMSIEKKAQLADYLINNQGSLKQLYEQVQALLGKLEKNYASIK